MSSTITRSTWSRIPPYLHRASIPLLIGLTVLQLHFSPETRSSLLAGFFFSIALLGFVLEKSMAPPTIHTHGHTHTHTSNPNNANTTSPKLHLAISLSRATLYAFIGDAAAAQLLLLLDSSSESVPLVLTTAMWAQLGLAGGMWLLGALLWVMEPIIYLVTLWRRRGATREEGRRAPWEKENGYSLLRQEEDSEEEV